MDFRFPVPAGVVGRVVQTAADPDASLIDLARLVEKDAALSAQLLRTVNSVHYGLRHRVGSVDRAVALMGMRAVRNLVLSLGIRDLVPKGPAGSFPLATFWECSLRRGAAARCIAERLGLGGVDEFFTLGLCQDIGLLVRIQKDKAFAASMTQALHEPAEERLRLEQTSGEGHDELGYAMFCEWRFPDELSLPIRYHHRPELAAAPHVLRARVAQAADAVADLAWVPDKHGAMKTLSVRLAALDLSEREIEPIVDRVQELVTEFAELLGMSIAEPPSFREILALASQGLAALNLSYEELTRRLEQSLEEQRRMAAELGRLNRELEQQARTDVLTGLGNRRWFDETLQRELAVAERQATTLSLVIIDLDRFKLINDAHGHQAGDRVLERVGQILSEHLRRTDTPARYGGEEFAAILPFTAEAGAQVVAARLREAIAKATVDWEGAPLHITASVGGASVESVTRTGIERQAAELIGRADQALYAAKREGRNRVCWSGAPVAG